jgi:hypothetical protein
MTTLNLQEDSVVMDRGGSSKHEESHADRVAALIADFTATHATA